MFAAFGFGAAAAAGFTSALAAYSYYFYSDQQANAKIYLDDIKKFERAKLKPVFQNEKVNNDTITNQVKFFDKSMLKHVIVEPKEKIETNPFVRALQQKFIEKNI